MLFKITQNIYINKIFNSIYLKNSYYNKENKIFEYFDVCICVFIYNVLFVCYISCLSDVAKIMFSLVTFYKLI